MIKVTLPLIIKGPSRGQSRLIFFTRVSSFSKCNSFCFIENLEVFSRAIIEQINRMIPECHQP